jgi:hypothetical protein
MGEALVDVDSFFIVVYDDDDGGAGPKTTSRTRRQSVGTLACSAGAS